MEYEYNKFALKVIRKQLGFRKGYIPKLLGVHVNTYTSWEEGSVMPFVQLLRIANFLRISVWSFVNIDGHPDAEHVHMTDRQELAGFKDTTFSSDTMAVYLNKERNMPISEICEKAHIGTPSYYLYFPKDKSKQSILQADKFFHLCNVFMVWPGSFLNNRGMEIPCLPGYEEALVMRHDNDIRMMTPEEKELADMRRTIALATKTSKPIEALQKQYDMALDSKLKQEREKHERSRARFNKRIEILEAQVREKDETIADLKQQLKEARFFADNHVGYAGLAAEGVPLPAPHEGDGCHPE